MDVDEAASSNRERWRRLSDEVLDQTPDLARFREVTATSKIGSNVDSEKLSHYLNLDPPRLVSMYTLRCAERDQNHAESEVYEKQPWGPRRAAIEDGLGCRRQAVYGTLDLPYQCGDPNYGPYRLVYEPDAKSLTPLLIPHNSASGYAHDGELDATALLHDVALWETRAELAVVMRGEKARAVSEADWPALLADEDLTSHIEADLIEVIVRDGERRLADVAEIRIEAQVIDEFLSEYLLAMASQGTITVELAPLVANRVLEAAENGDIDLWISDSS